MGNNDTLTWIITISVAIVSLFYVVCMAYAEELPYVDEDCAAHVACQSYVIYELLLKPDDVVVSTEDMTKDECEAMREMIESQTGPFQTVVCRPRLVERQEL